MKLFMLLDDLVALPFTCPVGQSGGRLFPPVPRGGSQGKVQRHPSLGTDRLKTGRTARSGSLSGVSFLGSSDVSHTSVSVVPVVAAALASTVLCQQCHHDGVTWVTVIIPPLRNG